MTGRRLVVVGGGVAGLAAARAARAEAERLGLDLRVTLLEASDRLGGKVFTEMVDGVPWEWGPDALVATKPRGRDLLEELGLLDEAVAPATGRAYLLLKGKLRPLPSGTAMGVPRGPGALVRAMRGGILSPWGMLRGAMEPLAPRLRPGDRDLERTIRTRFGKEVADRLVLPLARGVFGPAAGLDAAMPDLAGGRSLMLAARRRPTTRLVGLRGGMGTLVRRMAEDLGDADVRTGAHADSIKNLGGRLTVRTDEATVEADATIVAVPAPSAAALVRSGFPDAAGLLDRIPFSRSGIVHLRYPEGALGRPLDAAGYLRAAREGGAVVACSWVTAKWPRLTERGVHLRAVVDHPWDSEARVVEEVGAVMRAKSEPDLVRADRWVQALPAYPVEHGRLVSAIRAALPDGVEVAGASYEGVGVPDCVASGEAAARRAVGALVAGTKAG